MSDRDNLPRTVTAKQLIEELKQLPPNAPIAFASDYGDRCHTQQVHFLRGDIEHTPIEETAYADSGWAVDENGSDIAVYIIS